MKKLFSIVLIFSSLTLNSSAPRYINEVKLTEVFVKATRLWENKVDSAIYYTAKNLEVKPTILWQIIDIECGGNFKAENRNTKAFGCIQFTPRTLKYKFNMSLDSFKCLQDYEQLKYVELYFRGCKRKDLLGMYLHVFFPVAKSKPENWVLRAKGISAQAVAKYNKPFDLNKNNEITVGEIKTYLNTRYGIQK